MWVDRAITPRLQTLVRQFPAVLVTGARQTGKTSLLRRTFPDCAFASLDLPSVAEQAELAAADFLAAHAEPVIIDEVQYAPALFRFLKARIDADRHRMGRFLMTGSQKFGLMQSVSESLAGRCAILELGTLAAAEIRDSPGNRDIDPPDVLWRGGFPELYRNPELQPRDFLASYVATYLERDVRLSIRASSLRDFERFLRACALRSGNLANFTELARDVGIAATTARDWLSVLQASSQVVLLESYFGNLGKRLIKTPKLYFCDTGLLCFLLGIDSPGQFRSSPFVGAIWETFILNQILRSREARGSAAQVFFWRDAHGTEVDFVIEQAGRVRLIEAKWSESTPDSRSLAPLARVREQLGKRDAGEHWVACRTQQPRPIERGSDVRLIDGFRFDNWLD